MRIELDENLWLYRKLYGRRRGEGEKRRRFQEQNLCNRRGKTHVRQGTE